MFPAYVSPCGWGTIEANGAKDTNKSAIALHLRRHKPLELIGLSSRLPSHGATGANWGIGFHGCELPKILSMAHRSATSSNSPPERCEFKMKQFAVSRDRSSLSFNNLQYVNRLYGMLYPMCRGGARSDHRPEEVSVGVDVCRGVQQQ